MANPNMIGGGRLTRSEVSGDRRRLDGHKVNVKALLFRLWKYLGKNRLLLVLAMILSVSSSTLSLYGPKLSGKAINAIDLGEGKVDFDTVFRCAGLMVIFYIFSALFWLIVLYIFYSLSIYTRIIQTKQRGILPQKAVSEQRLYYNF